MLLRKHPPEHHKDEHCEHDYNSGCNVFALLHALDGVPCDMTYEIRGIPSSGT
jgi:hypothetical protein